MSEELEEFKTKDKINNCQKEQRAISDSRYAWQKDFGLVQKIVFTMLSLIFLSFMGVLIKSVIK